MTSDVELDRRLNIAAGHVNAQHAVLVDCTIELLGDPMLWQAVGISSIEQYLMWKLGITNAKAVQLVQIARRADDLPLCLDAFRAGRFSFEQMAPIARQAPWWCDAEMCDLAQMMTVRQIRFTVSKYPFDELAKPDGTVDNVVGASTADVSAADDDLVTDDAELPTDDDGEVPSDGDAGTDDDSGTRPGAGSDTSPGADSGADPDDGSPAGDASATCCRPDDTCWFGWGDDGRFRLHADVDGVVGSILESAMTEARDALFHGGNHKVDWVDALREMSERSLDGVSNTSRRDRFRVHVHLDATAISAGNATPPMADAKVRTAANATASTVDTSASTANGSAPTVTPTAPTANATDARGMGIDDVIRAYITCDALLTPVFEVDGIPISVGRSQRVIPERTRREVIRRDHGCAVPGCNQHRFLEVHHIIHWTDGGPTDLWNLIALCPQHHRLHHQGKLGITGNASVVDGVLFTNEHGFEIMPSGARPEPPGTSPPTPIGRYEHPLGGRLETRWLHFNLPPEHRRQVG